ncbi:MAG TPA: hypothetical protein VK459_05765 [Polyangiaceae bacterium]|nr:hypothetical protein [Polyangiaceae bacterium]
MSLLTAIEGAATMGEITGFRAPLSFSSLEAEVGAIRRSVAVSALPHVTALRVTGDAAYDALDRICPADLSIRDGRMRPTLLLRPDGSILADLYLCRDDEDFLLLAEGTAPGELLDSIRSHLLPGEAVALEDLSETHDLIALNGPFAPELLASLEGPEIIGFPYLTLARFSGDRSLVFRAGKTGEFGYDMLVPKASAEALWGRVIDAGAALDIRPAGALALWHAALENWFFTIHREGRAAPITSAASGLSPIELGLQWRVSHRKEFVGSEGLAARKPASRSHSYRATAIESDLPLAEGDAVFFEDRPIGAVLRAERSVTLEHFIGIGLIEAAYAHSGVDRYRAGAAAHPLRTVSAPFINNLSLYVNPAKHTFARRAEIPFPGPSRRI